MNSTQHLWHGITQIKGCNPESPLPPLLQMPTETPWSILGAAQYLALHAAEFDETIGGLVKRVTAAWQAQQCQVLVNERQQPWAYAGLALTSGDLDLITPFGHDDAALAHWQVTLSAHRHAFPPAHASTNQQGHTKTKSEIASTQHPVFDPYQMLGMICWLMNASDYHQYWPIQSLHTELMPALRRGQYRIYLNPEQQPRGFVSWAHLSADGLAQVLADGTDLTDADWDAGQHTMINDLIAPWGDGKTVIHHLRTEVFPKQRVLGVRRHRDGTLRKHFFFRGEQVTPIHSSNPQPPNSAASI